MARAFVFDFDGVLRAFMTDIDANELVDLLIVAGADDLASRIALAAGPSPQSSR